MPLARSSRPPVSFIAWSSVSGRSIEIATALGGDARCFYDFGFVRKPLTGIRYLASAFRTVAYLMIHQPRAVIASNPPIFPGLIAYAYGRIFRAPVILDSHPAAFGIYKSKRFIAVMMPVYNFLIPRVTATIVTVDRLVEEVSRKGGRAEIVHEAPPLWEVEPARDCDARPRVLFVGIFADDEPTDIIVEAASRLPHVDFAITGDLRKCPPSLADASPANISFTGFLDSVDYRNAINESNIVMALTRTPEGVSRAANEAVFARRPLIISDWPATRQYFPLAVHTSNTVDAVVKAIEMILSHYDEVRARCDDALAIQNSRWEQQLAVLLNLIAID